MTRRASAILTCFLLLSSSTANADTWERITDEAELRSLFSGVEQTTTLPNGSEATAVYRADGTGVLSAWGEDFERKWKVVDDEICLLINNDWGCFAIERAASGAGRYRGTNTGTGERVVFTVEGSKATAAAPLADDAGGATAASADEVARQLANPNTPLATLTLRTQFRTFEGEVPNADDQTSLTFLFQPSFPIKIGESSVAYFRPGIPLLIDQPVVDSTSGVFREDTGLGDIGFDLGMGTTFKETGLLLATGIVSTLPTATRDSLTATRDWRLGPEALVGLLRPTWILGAFPNHQWSVTDSADSTSLTTVQLFAFTLPGSGWAVGTSPIITFDWKEDDWSVPLNLDLNKTVVVNGRPWKLGFEMNYFVEAPDKFAPRVFLGINIAPVVENRLASLFQR